MTQRRSQGDDVCVCVCWRCKRSRGNKSVCLTGSDLAYPWYVCVLWLCVRALGYICLCSFAYCWFNGCVNARMVALPATAVPEVVGSREAGGARRSAVILCSREGMACKYSQ